MAANLEDLTRRLHDAQEALDTELKSWPNPSTDKGKAVIARTCMALRNGNGGFLIIGIKDDGSPAPDCPFDDVRATFHQDIVQEIISKYSSERFEIAVHFIKRDNCDRVMIEVPTGVRTPVICRLGLSSRQGGQSSESKRLLAENAVYVRTLHSNGRPSTAPAHIGDWPQLMETCFNNREADIGAFMRRQLSGLDINATTSALLEILQSAKAPSPVELADEYLDGSYNRFIQAWARHNPRPPDCGIRETAAVISGEFAHPELTQEFMLRLGSRSYSGWPPWVGILHAGSQYSNANVYDGGWESFEYHRERFHSIDFNRIDADGKFYYGEGLRDDLNTTIAPGTQLEFVIETARVAEIIATALGFAKVFCGSDSSNELTFAFRWRGLRGRYLSSWAHPDRGFIARTHADQDDVLTRATIPVEVATDAVGPYVEYLVRPLFMLFGGWTFESSVIQNIVTDRLRGRH